MNQLNLFEQYEIDQKNEKLSKAASDILAALNDGMKVKYEPHYYFQEGNFIVLMAVNKNKESVFNILDLDGNVPNGFSACWRNLEHIKQDLKQ
jgi:hypothetical protein